MSCKRWWWRGNDDQTGTSGRDWLFGGRGDNTIDGRGGSDFIWAGRGDDTVLGGEGNDLIFAGRGDDDVDGGEGNDRIYAGRGDDNVDGGRGNDRIYAGRGDDDVNGGDGDDKIYAGRGDDVVNGGAGNDKVYAGRGDDVVVHNVVENGDSRDYYNGGRGNDMLVLQMSHAEFNSTEVQADLEALDLYLAEHAGRWSYRAFEFESIDLKVRNFESYKVEFTDDAPLAKRQAPPQAIDDTVFVASTPVPILDAEPNDPSGAGGVESAQTIARSAFRAAPSDDVGDDSLPRVSIEGSIGDPGDVDVFKIELKGGETLILDVDHAYDPLAGNTLISLLYVADAEGNLLAEGYQSGLDQGGGGSATVQDPYLTFTAPDGGGTYHFAVSAFANTPGRFPGQPLPDGVTLNDFNDAGFVAGGYVLNVSVGDAASDLGALVIDPGSLLANDFDADGDSLTISGVGNAVNGVVELSSSGDILFRPATSSPGSFEYTVNDGNGGESTATVTVNGNPITGTGGDDVLVSTSEADMFVGGGGSNRFEFATGSGNDTIADYDPTTDVLVTTDSMMVANVEETSSNDTLVSFDTGDSVLLVGVTGVTGLFDPLV